MAVELPDLIVAIALHAVAVADATLGSLLAMYAGGMPDGLDLGALGAGAAAAAAAGAAAAGVGGGSRLGDGTTGGVNAARDGNTTDPIGQAVAARRHRLDNPTIGDRVGTKIFNFDRWLKETTERVVGEPLDETYRGGRGTTRN